MRRVVITQCALGDASCAHSDHFECFCVNWSTICIPVMHILSISHCFAHTVNILTDGGKITESLKMNDDYVLAFIIN